MKEKLKVAAKAAMSLLSIALAVMLVTSVFDQMYDFRLVLAGAGGVFGFQPLMKFFSKIKGLE